MSDYSDTSSSMDYEEVQKPQFSGLEEGFLKTVANVRTEIIASPGKSDVSSNHTVSNEEVKSNLFENELCFLPETSPMISNEHKYSIVNTIADDVELEIKDTSIPCLRGIEHLERICNEQGLKFSVPKSMVVTENGPCQQRELSVNCLQSMDELAKISQDQGLRFNCSDSGSFYEVDMILDDRLCQNEKFYLVKWKNYEMKFNTWEPRCHLTRCQDMIEYYEAIRSSETKVTHKLLQYFLHDLTTRRPYDILTLTKLCALCSNSSEEKIKSLKLNLKQLKLKAKEVISFKPSKTYKINNKILEIMKFSEARKPVLANLKEWETDINSFNPSAYVEVENNVDLETAPSEFQFIHDYINSSIDIPEEPVAFCHCDDCYGKRDSCCPHDSDGQFAYNRYRRLMLPPGHPIYECNKRCKCASNCINRVVQHGQKIKVAIFRTSNGCGWGLKTLENIEKGQFVLEYLGEIITSDAAEARGNIYDYIGRSYLFDLDYGVDNCSFTVDAGHVGNAAHFINHSCDPNLHVYAVWINQPDPNLPRLAFFARKKIKRGQELTFDYKMVKNHDRFGPQSPTPSHQRIECKCNSQRCRKYLF